MRRLYTTADLAALGVTRSALRWGERHGRWRCVGHGVYAEGPEPPTPVERQVALVVGAGSVARGALAGVLWGLDAVELDGRPTRRGKVASLRVEGVPTATPVQTLVDLAAILDDLRWEQALECALRKQLLTVADLELLLPVLGGRREPGTTRMRRVLALRPPGAPPTESLLETHMVQLVRTAGLPDPSRQVEVRDPQERLVARVDLAWPGLGVFVELDGEHHRFQPVYDASRETAVVAATGWLCGRFTWTEVVRSPNATGRRVAGILAQARRRPFPAPKRS
jgi:very-short-patch-repair endonuclease